MPNNPNLKHLTKVELIDGVTVTSVGVEYSRKLTDGDWGNCARGGSLWVTIDTTPDEPEIDINDVFHNLSAIVTGHVREQMLGFMFAMSKGTKNRVKKLFEKPEFIEAAQELIEDIELELEAAEATRLQKQLEGDLSGDEPS